MTFLEKLEILMVNNNLNIRICNFQVSFSTIRHNRHTMSITTEFLMPNLYGTCLYQDHILSPFSRNNRRYYRYR